MIIVFLGPPASGKGTQADYLHDHHGFLHFDTGSRLREEIASGSELGERIATFTNAGELVPIDIIKEMILKFLRTTAVDRIMFDGFPRNLDQAKVLADGLAETGQQLHCAVFLHIDEDSLLERIINRRFCSECGEIYNLVSRPPREEGKCDLDGAALIQREDDREDVFSTRLRVYLEETLPVLDYYREQGLLRQVDGDWDIDDVSVAIKDLLGV